MTKFSERLKELREEKGLSQVQLAKQSGLARSSINHWETKYNVPSIEAAVVLADFFNVSLDYLVGRVD